MIMPQTMSEGLVVVTLSSVVTWHTIATLPVKGQLESMANVWSLFPLDLSNIFLAPREG